MTLFIIMTVLVAGYGLLLAVLILKGKLVRQGWIAVAMTVAIILVAFVTGREEPFCLAAFPAMLTLLLCKVQRDSQGRRLKPEDKAEPEQADEEQPEE